VATTSRRLKLLRLNDYLEFSHIKQALMLVPDDAKFMNFGDDLLRACHYFVLEHPSFPEVQEGDMIPEMTVTMTSSPTVTGKKCTCGAVSLGSPGHAAWCDAY